MNAARQAPLVLLLACLALFGPGLGGELVWDDQLLVARNTVTVPPVDLAALWSADLWQTTPKPVGPTGYHRPLLLCDLALDRALFGLSAPAHRLHSLLWHLAAVGLAWRLFRRLGLSPAAAIAGLVLFALHPAQVEPVVFVSARNDPMAAVFLLGGLLLLVREAPRWPHLVGGAACVLAAVLSKETALLAPVLLALVRPARPGAFRAHGAVLIGILGALALRVAAGVGFPPGVGPADIARIAGPALAWQVRDLAWPTDLLPGRHLGWIPPTPWEFLVVAAGISAVLVVLGRRRAAAGLAFALVAWAPALVAIARLGGLPGRYLYLPLLGVGLAVGAAVEGLSRDALRYGVAAVLGAAGLVLGAPLVGSWQSDLVLWEDAIQRRDTPFVAGTYARVLHSEGRIDEAAALYARATAAPHPFVEACFNAASVHLERDRPDEAASAGLAALDHGCPASAELLAPTALGLALTGDWPQAEEIALQVEADPTGRAILVRVGAAALRGDLGPLEGATSDPAERAELARQVATVLERSGEVTTARRVLDAGG